MEKRADQLMALSTKLISYSLYGILALPLLWVVSILIGRDPNASLGFEMVSGASWETIAGFAALFLGPIAIGSYARKVALDIYDRVSSIDRLMQL